MLVVEMGRVGSGQVENWHKANSQAILDKFINRAENVSLNAIQNC